MIPPIRVAALVACLACSGPATAACFVVFDAADRVVYQGTTPPVDLSWPLSQAVATGYTRRHHLLMVDDGYCPGIGEALADDAPPPRALAAASPALMLAEGFRGRQRRDEAVSHGRGPIGVMDVAGPSAPAAPVASRPTRRRR